MVLKQPIPAAALTPLPTPHTTLAAQSNPDASDPSAFRLSHSRPGTLSLALTENDEDPVIKERPNYRNVEFLITTGPGPVPRLDGQNIVFGRVVEGLGAVSRITAVQTFRPSDGNGSMNAFAKLIGDDRAANVKRKYGRPLQAVIITDAGLLPANSAAA